MKPDTNDKQSSFRWMKHAGKELKKEYCECVEPINTMTWKQGRFLSNRWQKEAGKETSQICFVGKAAGTSSDY